MNVCLFAQELSFELMYKKQPLIKRIPASNVRMGGQFERYCFSCILRHDDVLRIVPQVVFLFRLSTTF